ncbi:MAG TPA: radical SAM family heme chaperone HemW, partial [Phycisphaerales bacterium]|nr:radical SAM family heme chaperone HemW [Phycisphaerales bacterium]
MAHNTRLNVLPQRDGGIGRATFGSALPAPGGDLEPARSLYIHVPFCFHKCHYCDFYSIVDTQDRQVAYTDRLIGELRALAPYSRGEPLRTIFVGGGTPSLLRVELWERLLRSLDDSFTIVRDDDPCAVGDRPPTEFTVECNPETVTFDLMATLRRGGVNRVSMGAQSFDRGHLHTLERRHDPENVPRAIELARGAGIRRRSVDLIFGIPGQSIEDWERDLDRALALDIEHLSGYSLTYEPGTAMTARLSRGEFARMDEEVEVQMHRAVWSRARSAGMERYEVSNFARIGRGGVSVGAECSHNLAYWRQESWLAAGPSASGHLRTADGTAGHRWKNIPRLDDYLRPADGVGTSPLAEYE